MMKDVITIKLPSLVHRIGGDKVKQAKAIADQCHCELKRVRRSRNWGVTAEAMKVQDFSELLKLNDDDGFRYFIQKIKTGLLEHADKLEPLEVKLTRLMNENPGITLGELVEQTQCTMAEARIARFDHDL